jgi:hypothetical protein
MANITAAELLERVKTARNETGDYHNGRISVFINEVKQYLLGAGVPAAVLDTDAVVGIVAIGVDDLMEDKKLSDYFIQRAIQLARDSKKEASG